MPRLASPVVSIIDEPYADDEPDARLDVYFPSTTAPGARLPTVVWVHGGAWISGHKESAAPYFALLAATGFTVVAVEYSRAPEARYPTPIRQVNDAIAHVLQSADRFHVDGERMFLAGDSAGAQIASQLAAVVTNPDYAAELAIVPALRTDQLRGVVLFCGAYDSTSVARHEQMLRNAALQLFQKNVLWAYTGTRGRDTAVLRQMSTIRHATADYPPTFISGGNADPLTDAHSRPFAARLDELGVNVTARFSRTSTTPRWATSTSSTSRVPTRRPRSWRSSTSCSGTRRDGNDVRADNRPVAVRSRCRTPAAGVVRRAAGLGHAPRCASSTGSVDVRGTEHVSTGHPIVFAANHSNTLADVAVVVAKAPRFPHFLAAASWWKRRSARVLFGLGGVLPLQRSRDMPGPFDNGRTFAACFDALADDAHLVIFPEGVMHAEPALQPLKTGAARIGLGAAERGVRGVVIVPMGLAYEDRGRFRSRAAVRFGAPIAMDDWLERYETDPFGSVRAITDLLATELAGACSPIPAVDADDRTRARVRDRARVAHAGRGRRHARERALAPRRRAGERGVRRDVASEREGRRGHLPVADRVGDRARLLVATFRIPARGDAHRHGRGERVGDARVDRP